MSGSPLPSQWETRWHPVARKWFFIDHARKITTWDDPRLNQHTVTPIDPESRSNASVPKTERRRGSSRTAPEESVGTASLVARQSVSSVASSFSTASGRSLASSCETSGRDRTISPTSSRYTSIATRQHNRNVSVQSHRTSSTGQRKASRSDEQPDIMGPLMELSADSSVSTHTRDAMPKSRQSAPPQLPTVVAAQANRATEKDTGINSTPKCGTDENRTTHYTAKTLAVGPNPGLLSSRLVPMGPDPALPRGPDASLVRGPLKLASRLSTSG